MNQNLLNSETDNLENGNAMSSNSLWSDICDESVLKELDEPFDLETGPNSSKLREDENYKGFDNNSGQTWIYPINFPIRTYQFNISKLALYRNTLVVLPTGLGKTFISAVVMYNIFRWYPKGKIIFMAPTRPLVAQQINACRKIMGISLSDTAEMTGKQIKTRRRELWQEKRIFFCTPQVVQFDLNDPEIQFPFKDIKLLVIDEAHKAKKKYAYVEVVQSINEQNSNFRVLALSATPGHKVEDVVEVIRSLLISHIEVRYENSIDVISYTHKKNIRSITVSLGENLTQIRNEFIDLIDPYIRNLLENGVLSGNISNMSRNWILMEQKRFREMSIQHRHNNHSQVTTNFSICISMYHALELLEKHGLRVFLNFFDDSESQSEKFFVNTNFKLKQFLDNLRHKVGPNPFAISDQPMTNGQVQHIPENLDFGHPKYEIAKNLLVDHFEKHSESRVIIFCEFRESVMLLHRLLLQNRPLIKPRCFVGQGGTGSLRAVTQKQQIKTMNDFRSGECNTLIATSVAEEGLDVGEVDLIVCFDISTKNPTRFVQRIGRTGRRRQGQVIMLATEGKEQSVLKDVLATKDKTNQKLLKNRYITNSLYQRSPRIIPPEFNPNCIEVFMKEPSIETESSIKNNTCVKKNKNSKVQSNGKENTKKKVIQKKNTKVGPQSQDVRAYFKKREVEFDPEDHDIFSLPKENKTIKQKKELTAKLEEDLNFLDDISKDYVVTQFDNTEYANEIENTDEIRQIESRYKKLNHMSRHLGKAPKYNKYSNIEETLKSKNVHKIIKETLLRSNPNYVHEILEKMKVLWALDSEDEIDQSEKHVRTVFAIVEDILGDRLEIEYFLKNFEKINYEKTELDNYYHNLDRNYEHFFQEFELCDFTDSIDIFIDEKLKEVDYTVFNIEEKYQSVFEDTEKDHSISKNLTTSIENKFESTICDQLDLDQEFESMEMETNSKYASQWTQFNNKNIINQSTPISKTVKRSKSSLEKTVKNDVPKNKSNQSSKKKIPCSTSLNKFFKIIDSSKNNTTTFPEQRNNENKLKPRSYSIEDKFEEIDRSLALIQQNVSKKKSFVNRESGSVIKKANATEENNLSFQRQNDKVFTLDTSKRNIAKENEDYEISADLFDDEFDEILAVTESISKAENEYINKNKNIVEIGNKIDRNKILKTEHPKKTKCLNSSIFKATQIKNFSNDSSKSDADISVKALDYETCVENLNILHNNLISKNNSNCNEKCIQEKSDSPLEQSMMTISQILGIVSENDDKKLNVTNPELEDFDSDEFLEQFNEEENLISSEITNGLKSSHKENSPPPSICRNVKFINSLSRQPSDDIFNFSSPKSANEIMVSHADINSKNQVKSNNKNFDLEHLTSPKRNSSHVIEKSNFNEISPSLIGQRKTNITKLNNFRIAKNLHTSSSEFVHKPSNKNDASTSVQASKSLNFSKALPAPNICKHDVNDTLLIRPQQKNKRIIESSTEDSDESECEILNETLMAGSQGVVVVTPTSKRNRSSFNNRQQLRRQRKRLKRCEYFDDEAAYGDTDTEEETMEDQQTLDEYNSIIDYSGEHIVDTNMHAKYLQSIRSPLKRSNGAFKIPPPRKFMDMSKIFSQPVQEETIQTYKEDSFVVSDEELVIDSEAEELSPLARAEAILRQERREKRKHKAQSSGMNKRRRILDNIHEISDDDDNS